MNSKTQKFKIELELVAHSSVSSTELLDHITNMVRRANISNSINSTPLLVKTSICDSSIYRYEGGEYKRA